MKLSLLDFLECTVCAAPFAVNTVTAQLDDHVVEGTLQCTTCAREVPIVRSVPRFAGTNNYAESFGFQWNRFASTQLDSVSGTAISRERFFMQTALEPSALQGTLVLDAGCGAGRFAEVALSAGATVIGLDYSSAVDASFRNLGAHPRFHLLQADLFAGPFRKGIFDLVYSFGVLMSTRDARAGFLALVPLAKQPGGRIVVDVYGRSWRTYIDLKYWIRPVTRRVPAPVLLNAVRTVVPKLLPFTRALGKVPVVGRRLKRVIPIADYRDIYPLSDAQIEEWAVLDTFDMLSPVFDDPQTPNAVRRWFEEAGLCSIEVFRPGHLVGRGLRP
jgi:SAM-dependent methyltransferase